MTRSTEDPDWYSFSFHDLGLEVRQRFADPLRLPAEGETLAAIVTLHDGQRLAVVLDRDGMMLLPVSLPTATRRFEPANAAERGAWLERLTSILESPDDPPSAITLKPLRGPPPTIKPLGWSADGVLMFLDTHAGLEDEYVPHVGFVDATTGRHLPWHPPPQPLPPFELAEVVGPYYAPAFDLAESLAVEPVVGTVERVNVYLRPDSDEPTHYRATWQLDWNGAYPWTVIEPLPRCNPHIVAPGACPPPEPVADRVVDAFLLRSPDERHHLLVFENDESTCNEGPYVVPPLPLPPPPTQPVPLLEQLNPQGKMLPTLGALTEDLLVLCTTGELRPLGNDLIETELTPYNGGARYVEHRYALPCEAIWAFGASTPGLSSGGGRVAMYDLGGTDLVDDPGGHGPTDLDPGGPYVDGERVRTFGDLTYREHADPEGRVPYGKRCVMERCEHRLALHSSYGCQLYFAGDVNGDGHTDTVVHTGGESCEFSTLYLSAEGGWQAASQSGGCE